jgi:probable HAF family extracellular repeat protein
MADLGTLGGAYSIARGINNAGQVIGQSLTAGGFYDAFLYSSGSMADLGTLGGAGSNAYGINNFGQVVGASLTAGAGGQDHAFLYSAGSISDLNNLIDPSSGWNLNVATAINDSGQIVGFGSHNGQTEAFLLTPTPTTPAAVPAPPAVILFGLGFGCLTGYRRWKSRHQVSLAA